MKFHQIKSLILFWSRISVLGLLCMTFPCSSSSNASWYKNCGTAFSCGNMSEIGYPFWGGARPNDCGYPGLELTCEDSNVTVIEMKGQKYQVLGINKNDETLNILREDLNTNGLCLKEFVNTTLDFSLFDYTSASVNLTMLYGCPSPGDGYGTGSGSSDPTQFTCNVNGSSYTNGYVMYGSLGPSVRGCYRSVVFPVMGSLSAEFQAGSLGLEGLIAKGFEVKYKVYSQGCNSCTSSNGRCGYDLNANTTTCICPDGTAQFESCGYSDTTASGIGSKRTKTIASLIGIGIFVVLGLLILLSFYVVRKCKPVPKNQRVEDMLKNYESLVPRQYTYTNIMKITNSFREKLGEGGYGTVFKGKLQDGRAVAVKVWKQSKGDGHEFANEVVSICSTSHINIVPLLGFCFEGLKGALIYEFMPNGSLEKFIRGRDFNKNNRALSCQKLFEIVVGIARGLEYIHRDCNTRIVHFDIKPHNILLDEDFIPKISDFGLAKPFKQKESIISISGARGTAGYIAPEVFFSSFGGVSHKSDVYGYGMMVLEMVGCTKRPDENVENSSELYFPRWIYKQLEQGATLDCAGRVLNDENKELERKMVLVGLWCIQTNPRNRPSMCRVLAMLNGEVELEVPPMPSLASPPRQQQPTDDGSVSGSFLSSATHAPSNNPEISTSNYIM